MGTTCTIHKEFLRKSLKLWSNFEMILQECSLGDLFKKKMLGNFDLSINMVLENEGYLLYNKYYGHKEIFQNSSPLKLPKKKLAMVL